MDKLEQVLSSKRKDIVDNTDNASNQVAKVKETNTHDRKKIRLKIAEKTISLSFGALGVVVIILFSLMWLSAYMSAQDISIKSIDNYINLFSFIIASIFSILTLSIGFVAGSSID